MASLVSRGTAVERTGGRAQDRHLRGIALMIGATMLLSVVNAVSKILIARYPVGEVMVLRSSTAMVMCCAWLIPANGLSIFATRRPAAHIGRGLSQAVSQTLTVAALGLLPLASVTAIGFSAPLFAAVVEFLFYGERPNRMRGAVLIVGFIGVLIVTRPGSDTLQLGALLALGNAVMYGSVTVAVRSMTKTESASTLLVWQMGVMTIAHAGLLVFGFRCPTAPDALLFVLLGSANAGAQLLWTRALASAPTVVVSPFYYLMLVWGTGLGLLAFGEVPEAHVVIGGVIVAAAGLTILLHEGRILSRLATLARQGFRPIRRRAIPPFRTG